MIYYKRWTWKLIRNQSVKEFYVLPACNCNRYIHSVRYINITFSLFRNYNGRRGKPISKDEAMKELIEVVSITYVLSYMMN
jgi:hypothetical protein